MRLHLGCGNDYREGWVNHDSPNVRLKREPEVRFDLDREAWTCFDSNSFELVEANHLFEHLEHPENCLREVQRILKPEGVFVLRVPHFSRNWLHSVHKTAFSKGFYEALYLEGYFEPELVVESVKLKWFDPVHNKFPRFGFLFALLDKVITPLANLNITACERLWCYWVGGFDEIEFVFRKRVMR